MRQQGTVVKWNHDKGFGFIRSDDGGDDAFAHIKSFQPPPRTPPDIGLRVTYDLKLDAQDRLQALKIQADGDTYTRSIPPLATALVLFALYAASVVFLYSTQRLGGTATCGIAAVNVFTFIFYWRDKSRALHGQRRTPENTLHLLALLGGWPAARVAQQWLKHKNRKTRFQIAYWVTVVLNMAGMAALLLR